MRSIWYRESVYPRISCQVIACWNNIGQCTEVYPGEYVLVKKTAKVNTRGHFYKYSIKNIRLCNWKKRGQTPLCSWYTLYNVYLWSILQWPVNVASDNFHTVAIWRNTWRHHGEIKGRFFSKIHGSYWEMNECFGVFPQKYDLCI